MENSGLLGCVFGDVRVEAIFVNPMQITGKGMAIAIDGSVDIIDRISIAGGSNIMSCLSLGSFARIGSSSVFLKTSLC
jgi:hypothetical protein